LFETELVPVPQVTEQSEKFVSRHTKSSPMSNSLFKWQASPQSTEGSPDPSQSDTSSGYNISTGRQLCRQNWTTECGPTCQCSIKTTELKITESPVQLQ